MDGVRVASIATARASGTGHRTRCHRGVVSRHTNNATRNHVRYSGSSRLTGRSGTWSVHRVKNVYAVSNTTYGTASPVTNRRSRPGLQSKFREKYPDTTMNMRHVKGVHEQIQRGHPRLPSRNGSHACPTATSTIARYFALSKKASRSFERSTALS